MNIETLTAFFAWTTTLHLGILIISSVCLAGFRKPILKIHHRLMGIPETELSLLYFRFLAYYKLGIFLFSLVPYLAMRMVLGSYG